MEILKQAQAVNDWVVALRRDFHMHPEPSGEEVRTAEIVERELKNLGISVKRIGKTGVLGDRYWNYVDDCRQGAGNVEGNGFCVRAYGIVRISGGLCNYRRGLSFNG